MSSDLARTCLYEAHLKAGARMAPYGGWEMPLHYGSQLQEHQAVRQGWGVFDVSHMQQMEVFGTEAEGYLRHLLANDVARIPAVGQAQYGVMLNERGGVVDDLLVYRLGEGRWRLVTNAGTRAKVAPWLARWSEGWRVTLRARPDLAMLAIQGPQAVAGAARLLPGGLRAGLRETPPFHAVAEGEWLVARTGYTGEDGCEVMLPEGQAEALWDRLLEAGAAPCGLGARDTLRLEAGLNLYGADLDEEHSPLESGLAWTVAWEPRERDFVGRAALEQRPLTHKRVAVVLEGKGVLRDHQTLWLGAEQQGGITSGSFSPTLGVGVGLARVARGVNIGDPLEVEMRGRRLPVRVTALPLVQRSR